MEGAALAAERRQEFEYKLAHSNAAWVGAAFAGKLKRFDAYKAPEPLRHQSGDEMIANLRQLKEMGAPMSIEEVN